jgi:putative phosphoesterase
MPVAIISDIHGNIKALEAVLSDIKKQGLEEIYCAGDLVGYAPFPNEVIDLILRKNILTIMGNYDDGVGFDKPECGCAYIDSKSKELGKQSIEWTKKEVSAENKEFLRSLPTHIDFKLGDFNVKVVHGSLRKINEYLFEDKPEQTLRRIVEETGADILVCGHTHKPYHKVLGDKHLVNVGSVGKPKHGDSQAVYGVLDLKSGKLEVQFIKIPYDVESVAQAIEKSKLPNEFAVALWEGRG